jgi:hypothetical protein
MLARNLIETKTRRIEQGKGRMTAVQCDEASSGLDIEPHHVAEYVSDMLVELRDMSAKANLNVLACLLEAARQEAEDYREE